jgi:peptide chain release factor 2
MAQPGFWDDSEAAQRTVKELKRHKGRIGPVVELAGLVEDLEVLLELAESEDDAEAAAEVERDAGVAEERLEQLEFRLAMGDPHDPLGCYLSVHAGAGGTDAADWAAMLARMYTRYADGKGWSVEEIDSIPAEEAGVRKAVYRVEGDYAFGYLKNEAGVHRLVRLSPFDANNRRQTSFASVDVVPDVEEEEIEVDEGDLKIDTYRAGGAGGQHVNKTDSAVRITHLPTGIVVQCQSERSQHKNRATAMTLLRLKLYRAREAERDRELQAKYSQKSDNEFGSQIRSYVLHPYQMVKDLRSGQQTSDTQGVLDGEIDAFVEAEMRRRRHEAKAAE